MKKIFLSGMFIISFLTPFALFTSPVHAVSTYNSATLNHVPSIPELRTAITRIESLDHYFEYQNLSAATLRATTEFYKEYDYLYRLVADLNHIISIYNTMRPEDLVTILRTAEDAVVACKLKFGITKREYLETHTPSPSPSGSTSTKTPSPTPETSPAQEPSSNPSSSTTKTSISNSTQPSGASPSSTIKATLTTSPSSQSTETPNSEVPSSTDSTSSDSSSSLEDSHSNLPETSPVQSAESEPVAVPLTNSTDPQTHSPINLIPQFIIISTALALIATLIITNRRRPYRPGRHHRRF